MWLSLNLSGIISSNFLFQRKLLDGKFAIEKILREVLFFDYFNLPIVFEVGKAFGRTVFHPRSPVFFFKRSEFEDSFANSFLVGDFVATR